MVFIFLLCFTLKNIKLMFFLMFFDGFDILIDKEIQLQIIGKKQITIKKTRNKVDIKITL